MTRMTASLVLVAACAACGGDKTEPPAGAGPAASRPASGAATTAPAPATAEPSAAAQSGAEAAAAADLPPEPPPGDGALMQEPFDPEEWEASRPKLAGQDGVAKEGARFEDQNGANVVVLVHQVESGGGPNSRRLWAYHYIDEGGKPRLLREVTDKEENCELDNAAGWVDGSLQITDTDGDGLGEVTFAYDLGCRGDVSPKIRKLVILEDGKKWILRGESRVDIGGGERSGGAYREDPARKKWPKQLLAHAVAAWERLIDR